MSATLEVKKDDQGKADATESMKADTEARTVSEPINQVRDLLFGETQRETSDRLNHIEDRLREIETRLDAKVKYLEEKLFQVEASAKNDTREKTRKIGSAIAQLGEHVKTLGSES